ncbi:MAG: NUDIX domain-containing protein [Chlamydiota bacterium]|jgi:8-oxo-dGTP pyrophosphatase MutT (NUDIX family)
MDCYKRLGRMDIRRQITQIIEQINPLDEEENKHKNLVSEWINSGAELFRIQKPDIPKMHLVSYFVPIDEIRKKILLVHHKKANLWLPPGGHVEKNEHPQQTVVREMEEELFTPAIFHLSHPVFLTVAKTVNNMDFHTDVSLWYLVKGDARIDYAFDEQEFYKIQWFSLDEVPYEQVEPHLSRFLKKLNFLTLVSD